MVVWIFRSIIRIAVTSRVRPVLLDCSTSICKCPNGSREKVLYLCCLVVSFLSSCNCRELPRQILLFIFYVCARTYNLDVLFSVRVSFRWKVFSRVKEHFGCVYSLVGAWAASRFKSSRGKRHLDP